MAKETNRWKRVKGCGDLRRLEVSITTAGTNPVSVVMWRIHAREDAFDVQDGQGYVYAYGAADSLYEAQDKAIVALRSAINAVNEQVGL